MSNKVVGGLTSEGSTDFSEFIVNNVKNIILGILFFLAIGVSIGFYKYQSKKAYQENSEHIYEFSTTSLKSFQDKKTDWDTFYKNYTDLQSKVGDHGNFFVLTVNLASDLMKQKDYEKASQVLEPSLELYKKAPYQGYLLGQRLGVAYENLGKNKEALSVLQSMLSNPKKLMEARTYFDMGRLHKKLGEVSQAKENFQYVIDKFPNNKEAKLAGIYLRELN